MFGLGMTEIILIAVVALLVIGPKRLPDVAKSIGKGYGEFRRSFGDLKQAVNLEDHGKPSAPAGQSATQSKEERREELVATYKSQWEQKLPPAQASESPYYEKLKEEDAVKTENNDGGDKSGK